MLVLRYLKYVGCLDQTSLEANLNTLRVLTDRNTEYYWFLSQNTRKLRRGGSIIFNTETKRWTYKGYPYTSLFLDHRECDLGKDFNFNQLKFIKKGE